MMGVGLLLALDLLTTLLGEEFVGDVDALLKRSRSPKGPAVDRVILVVYLQITTSLQTINKKYFYRSIYLAC